MVVLLKSTTALVLPVAKTFGLPKDRETHEVNIQVLNHNLCWPIFISREWASYQTSGDSLCGDCKPNY